MGMMINRRRVMGGKALPYDAEVEWLKSVSGAYIDTGIKASGNLRIKTTLYDYFTSIFFTKWCFGGRNGYLDRVFGLFINGDYRKVFFSYGNLEVILGNYQEYPQVAQVEIGNGGITIGGKQYSYPMKTFTSDYSLYLFGSNNGGARVNADDMKMGDTYITDGVTTLDLIPVRKNGKGYMYDKLSGKLFGTGDFIAGPDK